jgi:photosystem II stability/assembly factor-like uncharacterized protein
MNKRILSILSFALLVLLIGSSPALAQESDWQEIPLPRGTLFFDLVFQDDATGWAVGANSATQALLFKTGDGGQTWSEQARGGSNDRWSSLAWLDTTTGYIEGYNMTSRAPFILHSVDGGQTWQKLPIPFTTGDINGLCLQPGGALWVPVYDSEAHSYHTWYSADGVAWSEREISPASGARLRSIFFPTSETGYAAGDTGGDHPIPLLMKSSDGGQTWQERPLPLAEGSLTDVFFLDELNGFTSGSIGDFGVILKTRDGGETWTESARFGGSSHNVYQVRMGNPMYGVARDTWSDGKDFGVYFYETTDGGDSWTQTSLPHKWTTGRLAVTGDKALVYIFNKEADSYSIYTKPLPPYTPPATQPPPASTEPPVATESPAPTEPPAAPPTRPVTLSLSPEFFEGVEDEEQFFTASAKDELGNILPPENPVWSCMGECAIKKCSGYTCTVVFTGKGYARVTVQDYGVEASATGKVLSSFCGCGGLCNSASLPLETSLSLLALTFGAVFFIQRRMNPPREQ